MGLLIVIPIAAYLYAKHLYVEKFGTSEDAVTSQCPEQSMPFILGSNDGSLSFGSPSKPANSVTEGVQYRPHHGFPGQLLPWYEVVYPVQL